jgi:hypothetical protein
LSESEIHGAVPNLRAALPRRFSSNQTPMRRKEKPYKVRMEKPTAITVIADVHALSIFVPWLYDAAKDDGNSALAPSPED